MAGDNQYVQLIPRGVQFVEVDLDPTFSDLITNAYLSMRLFIPSSIKPDLTSMSIGTGQFQGDDFFLAMHEHAGGTLFDWWSGSGAGTDFAPITFDAWTQIEVHAVAGASAYDARIDGVLYPGAITSAFLPATGINYWGAYGFNAGAVGDGGGTEADDTIGVDELAWSLSGWISQGATVAAVWAFDGADPIVDAGANYPDPPWFAWDDGDPTALVIATGGGTLADLFGDESEPDPPPDPIGCCADDGELEARVFIGGTEVTNVSVAGGWTPRLNRPAQATCTLPMDAAVGDVGDLLRIEVTDGIDSCIVFHGRILNREVDSSKDEGRVVYNAQDAMEILQYRVVRDDDGDFSKPRIIEQYAKGPAIIRAILINSVDSTGRTSLDSLPGGPPPGQAEGPLPIQMGSFATGGPNLLGAPVDWPMKISEMISLLVSTGQVDVVMSPINPGGGITNQIDVYNGNYGTDRSGSVLFSYGMGARNVANVKWNRDMTQMVNKYQLYGGPQIATSADPKGDQHWCFNVTGDDTNLARPPGGDVNPPYSGGDAPGSAGNPLGQRRLDSQAAYDVRYQVDIVDGYDDNCVKGFGAPGRDLFRYQWQVFSWLAAMPRDLIHVLPVAGTQIGCFGIGDLIGVEASADVLGGFSGAQRVYQYTVSWEATPSVLTLSEIQVSSDNEGAF